MIKRLRPLASHIGVNKDPLEVLAVTGMLSALLVSREPTPAASKGHFLTALQWQTPQPGVSGNTASQYEIASAQTFVASSQEVKLCSSSQAVHFISSQKRFSKS